MKWITNVTVVPVMVLFVFSLNGYAADAPGIPPETVADYVRAVIQAHRSFYTTHVVDRLSEQGGAKADGEWRTHKMTLPLPVQLVNETSNMFHTKSTGIRYRLMSLWPINPLNGPPDQADKNSLEAVAQRPERPVTRTRKIDDQTYFNAIYADIAASQSCVDCHNTHPRSPKRDFKVGEVMGGLVIEFPLGNQ